MQLPPDGLNETALFEALGALAERRARGVHVALPLTVQRQEEEASRHCAVRVLLSLIGAQGHMAEVVYVRL